MTALFVYLVKVNIALVVFCGGYYAVLRHLTFYTLNRVYLVCAILFATLYPLVDFSALLYRHQEIARPVQVIIVNWQAPVAHAVQVAQQHNKWFWLGLVFWAGVIILATRFIMQLLSLYKLHKQSKPIELHQYLVRVIQGDINPFSFWKSIYINPDNHEPHELKAILAHEQVHVNEWHTLDILLGELSTIFYWFNPGVWLMKKAIRENIEFITDQKILQSGSDPKTYQYSLLNVSFNGGHSAIVNHFNTSTIKKRIIMMNSKRSSTINLTRYAVLVPAVILLVLVFSVSKAELGRQVAKGNAAIAKAFNVTINTIIPGDISRATTVAKRKLMVLPNAVGAFLTNDSKTNVQDSLVINGPHKIIIPFRFFPKLTDTPKVGKIVGGIDGNVITVVGYGKQKNDTMLVLNDGNTQTLLKKMEGFTVTSAGKTMVNGKEVRAVRLNGNTYYSPMASVRADSISKIQVISKYSRFEDSNGNPTAFAQTNSNGTNNYVIRGVKAEEHPLILVNGVPAEGLNSLNPNIIESVNVLKDPAYTTAIYGDKAKGGVIQITTKNRSLSGSGIVMSGNTIRGYDNHTITGLDNTQPLIIINGKIQEDNPSLAQIPQDDIESMTVLKPTTATNMYGDRAKGGAILVTTKSRGEGERIVNGFKITTEPRVFNFNTKNIFSGKLLLLDGKETTESELNKIPADKIKVIKPLTEKEKTKYGDKAKNGGFSITTNK